MQFLKDNLRQYGTLAILLISTVSIPVYSGLRSYQPAEVVVQAAESKPAASVNDLLPLLQLIAQRQPAAQPVPQPVQQPATLQPIRDPMIEAINLMDRNHKQLLQQIVDRDKKMSEQLTQFINASYRAGSGVDRSGNTKEQLADIYEDANVPDLPDPIVKGLAAHPGSRAMIHPDHGQPVIAVTEWGVTNYGGGKQLNLIRHKGKMYGQTIMHGSATPQQAPEPPKPEPFRLNLGNN